MKYHPDLNPNDPGAAEEFKQVQWAYETLSGTKKSVPRLGRQGQYEGNFSEEAEPFSGFFWAMREHYAGKKAPE
jgi:DnaJ-class molecular chaperone